MGPRIVGIGALAAAIGVGVGLACVGGGYDLSWDAEASSAILSPGNDTRSNFLLLMADRYGTEVADRTAMSKGIVPFDFPYKVMIKRLNLPGPGGPRPEPAEAYGLSSDDSNYFSYDSGNIGLCHSNRDGAAQFAAALTADSAVPAGEKATLSAARTALAGACDKAGDTHWEFAAVASPDGRAFAHYVEGARLFYAEQLPGAATEFGAVGSSSSAWLTETAAYMRFRTALAQALKASIGEWGDLVDADKRDRASIDRADQLRQHYLQAYPTGRYAVSARNLGRRIAWLRGDRKSLGGAYSAMLERRSSGGTEANVGLIEEIDRRIVDGSDGSGVTDPTLLAVIDLMRLRPKESDDYELEYRGPPLGRADLEQQRTYFATQPELFGYLLAAEAFYGRHQAREVLQLIPDAAHQARFGYVQFSRQMLRGFALEAVGDRNARAFWVSLLPGAVQPYQREAVELAIFRHDEKAGVAGRLLEAGSPIRHPLIRQKIIEDDAGPELLRQQATAGATQQQREVALYLLLANELHHGRYREFLGDRLLVGKRPVPANADGYGWSFWSVDNYDPEWQDEVASPPLEVFTPAGSSGLAGCPEIAATATALAEDPAAIRPQLCLAEFIRRRGFDDWGTSYDQAAERRITAARNGFPGKPLERMNIYMAVLASPAASADDKAFALNRAIRCYQPVGSNSCGGDDVEQRVRKAWFDRLKSQYPNSPWARELKYYW